MFISGLLNSIDDHDMRKQQQDFRPDKFMMSFNESNTSMFNFSWSINVGGFLIDQTFKRIRDTNFLSFRQIEEVLELVDMCLISFSCNVILHV